MTRRGTFNGINRCLALTVLAATPAVAQDDDAACKAQLDVLRQQTSGDGRAAARAAVDQGDATFREIETSATHIRLVSFKCKNRPPPSRATARETCSLDALLNSREAYDWVYAYNDEIAKHNGRGMWCNE